MSTKVGRTAKRLGVSFSFACLALAVPAVASAQPTSQPCEPGSWFCGEANGGTNLQQLPDGTRPAETKPAAEKGPPPPVVIYQPPPPTVVIQPRDAPPAYYYVPRKPVRKREFGLNLHLGGLLMGSRDNGYNNNNAGMVTGGVGLRYRPIPHAAIEANLDFAGGRDYNGYRRHETAGTINGLLFLNPRSMAQFYLLGGFGWSGATAIDDSHNYDRRYEYTYFGVQGGAGVEFRLSRSVALNVDLRGLVRGRIDDHKDQYAEFTSASGKTTNTSGAGILNGGITFYW